MNNQQQHKNRINKYNPRNADEAISLILSLNNSDFNNYSQMIKDVKLICNLIKN